MLEAKDTSASALQKRKDLQIIFSGNLQKKKKKKRSSEKLFSRSPERNRFPKNFSGPSQTFNNSKKVLSSSRGLGYFRGLEVRGQGFHLRGQGLHLRGQGLQNNVFSRPRTSLRIPPPSLGTGKEKLSSICMLEIILDST